MNAATGRSAGLLRILGVGFGLAVMVGSTLGIGILRTPGLVAGQLASRPSILGLWIAGGLYTLLCAVLFTELGTMLPEAGGYYVYARHAFGDTVGFAVGWMDWLTYCAVLGYECIAIGEFSAMLVPALQPLVKTLAVGVLVLFAALQFAGLRVGSRFQEVTTAVKCVAFLALVAACLGYAWRSGRAGGGPLGPAAAPVASGLVGLVVALQSVVITYGGWQSPLYFTEEDRDPRQNLPRSMIGGVVSVAVIYLLVNVALLSVLPIGELARSTLPAANAAEAIFGSRGGRLITLLSIVSLPPLINAILMIGTRILFAVGRDGLAFRRAAVVNARGTPIVAALVTTAVAAALVATGTFQTLVAVASFFLTVNNCVGCVALFALRRRQPLLARPFRAWGYPWSALVVLGGALAFLAGILLGDTRTAVVAVVLIAAGLLARAVMGLRAI